MQHAKFYCFPFCRHPLLMYRDKAVLQSELFKVFYYKLFRSRKVLEYRRTNNLFQWFGETMSTRRVIVPNQDIQLIYGGYDSKVMFEMDRERLEVTRVWRGIEENEFRAEPFLGYPVFYDYTKSEIGQVGRLGSFLRNHWFHLKEGGASHGDLTHYNLLINPRGRVRAIDAKTRRVQSALTDLFYFYTFFLHVLNKHLRSDSTRYQTIISQLDSIFISIFSEDDHVELLSLASQVRPSDLPNSAALQYTSEFSRVIETGRRFQQ